VKNGVEMSGYKFRKMMRLFIRSLDSLRGSKDMEMEFIESGKGGLRLCYGGFVYTKKAEKKNRIRWECSNRLSKLCKGAVTTSLEVRKEHI